MPFSMSQASLPSFEISLNALSAILDKAAAYAAAKKIDPSVLLHTRLSPNMFDLARQVQVAADNAKNGSARLAGVEPPATKTTRRPSINSRRGWQERSRISTRSTARRSIRLPSGRSHSRSARPRVT